jgi:phytoene synthase
MEQLPFGARLAMGGRMSRNDFAAEQVRLYDHDRYLTAIFAPAAVREHALALFAFNIEIAKTREVVSEPLIGRMRLQWWRDALDVLYGGGTIAHEIARPLGDAIRMAELDRRLFDRLIDTREADLDDAPPADLVALEAYAEGTGAPLMELALALSGRVTPDAADAARAVGTAWALTGILRAVPFHARQHRLFLPADRLSAAGVRMAKLFDLKPDRGVADVVREVGARAIAELDRAKGPVRSLPKNRSWPFLLASLSRLYLRDLEENRWDPFATGVVRGRPLAILHLAIERFLGRC